MHRSWSLTYLVIALLLLGDSVYAQEAIEESADAAFNLPNINAPTLGGTQFWTSHTWRDGWRIQQNSVTGHWRLVDAENIRHAWGNRSACEDKLNELLPKSTWQAPHVVIYLHGLVRSSRSMHSIGDFVTEKLHWPAIYFEYASSRSSISDHAQALREFIACVPADSKLSFVGHSMGNIVLRHTIGDLITAKDQASLDRFHRIVMLGPPNQGATIARQLSKTKVFGFVAGPAGLELGPNWQQFESKLAVPPCPFAVVAGKLPEHAIANPLVDAESDFVVSVDETKLEGMADFAEVPQLHSFLMDDKSVQELVVSFLAKGHF